MKNESSTEEDEKRNELHSSRHTDSDSAQLELTRLHWRPHPADSDDDIRMHGTWPSDTDEEEDVRARRRRKGGKAKGKARRCSKSDHDPTTFKSPQPKGGSKKQKDASVVSKNISPPSDHPTTSPSLSPESHSDSSPSHPQAGVLCSTSSDSVRSCRRDPRFCEVVSETESQLASSKRNSRTESNTPQGSSSSVHSATATSPAKHAYPVSHDDVEVAQKVRCQSWFNVHISLHIKCSSRRWFVLPLLADGLVVRRSVFNNEWARDTYHESSPLPPPPPPPTPPNLLETYHHGS